MASSDGEVAGSPFSVSLSLGRYRLDLLTVNGDVSIGKCLEFLLQLNVSAVPLIALRLPSVVFLLSPLTTDSK